MKSKKKHVYFVPGMAAGAEIFRNIKLGNNGYIVEVLDWLIPEKNETLTEYAKRMALRVTAENPILVGVSFGGVVAQEMAQFLDLNKLIIISSVKTRKELPKRMKFAALTKAYKLIPTRVVLSVEDLTKFSLGPKSRKRLRLYQQYLHVRNKRYLDWALEKMVTWKRQTPDPKVVHIQGDRDKVFPIRYIKNCVVITGGTHIMILNRGREITKKLIEIIEE